MKNPPHPDKVRAESMVGALEKENARLREALGRIASNGFGHPTRALSHKRDAEMLAMMAYARAALSPEGTSHDRR